MPIQTYTRTCPVCGKPHSVQADPEHVRAWQHGAMIQDVLGYLDKADREILMTGIDNDCWQRMFPPEED